MAARLADGGALAVAVALVALVYHPITRNYFFADDFLNLQQVVNDSVPRWVFQPAAGHLLVVRNLLFSLFYAVFDQHASARETTERVLATIRGAIDTTPPPDPVYIPNQRFAPAGLGAPYFAGWASVYTIYVRDPGGRPVYFVEPDAAVRDVARPGTPLAAVLVAPPATTDDARSERGARRRGTSAAGP